MSPSAGAAPRVSALLAMVMLWSAACAGRLDSVLLTAGDLPAGFTQVGQRLPSSIEDTLRGSGTGYTESRLRGFANASRDTFIGIGIARFTSPRGAGQAVDRLAFIDRPGRTPVPDTARVGEKSRLLEGDDGYAELWRDGNLAGLVVVGTSGASARSTHQLLLDVARKQEERMRSIAH